MYKQDIVIVDNFFDDFNVIKNHFTKLSFFKREDYKPRPNEKMGNWPGLRTGHLIDTEPFLFNLFLKNLYEKVHYLPEFNLSSYLHCRLEEDEKKDWIHTDDEYSDYSGLVYLSNTNFNSGTTFYDEKDNLVADIKFVQNRFVFFKGKIRHRSTGNHGTTLENGRLTLNAFFNWIRR